MKVYKGISKPTPKNEGIYNEMFDARIGLQAAIDTLVRSCICNINQNGEVISDETSVEEVTSWGTAFYCLNNLISNAHVVPSAIDVKDKDCFYSRPSKPGTYPDFLLMREKLGANRPLNTQFSNNTDTGKHITFYVGDENYHELQQSKKK